MSDGTLFNDGDIGVGTLEAGECKTYRATNNASVLTLVNGNPSGSAGDQI